MAKQYTTLAQFAKLIADTARSSINKSISSAAKKSNVVLVDVELLSKTLGISDKSSKRILNELKNNLILLAKNPRSKVFSSRKLPNKDTIKVSVGSRSSLDTVIKYIRQAISKELSTNNNIELDHTLNPATVDKTKFNSDLLSNLSGGRISKDQINNIVDSLYKEATPERFNILGQKLGLDVTAIHKAAVNQKKLDAETGVLLAIPEEANRFIGSSFDQLLNNEIASRIEKEILKTGSPEDLVSIDGLEVVMSQLFKDTKKLNISYNNKKAHVNVKLESAKVKGITIRTRGFKFENGSAVPANKNSFTFTSLAQLVSIVNSQLQSELFKTMPHADSVGTSMNYLRYDTGNFSRIARVDLEFLKDGKDVGSLLIKPRFLEGSDGPMRYSTFIPPSGAQSSEGRDPSNIIGSAARNIIQRYMSQAESVNMLIQSMSRSSNNRYVR